MKISFTIITYNSEPVIERALKSIEFIADEIIVVDSGSTDNTVNIARKYKAKIFTKKFENDYAAQKNYAISKATGDWIFCLDSDEVLSESLREVILELMADTSIDGYWFRRKNYISPNRYLKYGLFYPDYQLRLFRNKKQYRFIGAIHEKLTIPTVKTRETEFDILHYQQRPKYMSFGNFSNLLPYVEVHTKELAKTNNSSIWLVVTGIYRFILLFFSGYIRGKGFLDGWAGFRSHILFAASISLAYIRACQIRSNK